jgi:hypothetical protein
MYGYGFVNTFNIHGTGAPAFDADAQAFITAASITDPTQQSAVNQLVLDWKADGIWNDIDEAYPYVGSNSTAHRYDIKSATAKGTFFGGVTHNGNGVTFNGTTGFMSSSWSCTAIHKNTNNCCCLDGEI